MILAIILKINEMTGELFDFNNVKCFPLIVKFIFNKMAKTNNLYLLYNQLILFQFFFIFVAN